MSNPLPVKYVLYSHYSANQDEDFSNYENNQARPEDLKGVGYLTGHFRGLRELLTTPGHEGLLVLFYAPETSFLDFLNGIEVRLEVNALLAKYKSLRFAQAVANYVQDKLAENEQLKDRVRFLTPLDLHVIFGRVNATFQKDFATYFIGPEKRIRYDTPKLVEAILRLRLIGNGVPLFRLDHDVIFRGNSNKGIGDLGLFKAVACSVRAYQLRLDEPTVSTFLFSASYNSRTLLFPEEVVEGEAEKTKGGKPDPFESWSRAFATRVYPALKADPTSLYHICNLPEDEQKDKWYKYVEESLDEELLRQFYGLKEDKTTLEVNGIDGLTSIGAHPLFAVISGALLCLSEGAILDLPPFSNFHDNVMWIDDHLKYSLHRAMNHFTSDETLTLEAGLNDARLDNVMVTKARPSVKNLPGYVFGDYLPTLLLGAIMDAWITNNPILKCRLGTLSINDQKRWQVAKRNQNDALLPKAIREALNEGEFSTTERHTLKEDLAGVAAKRIEEVRTLWAKLKRGDENTFASYWAEGKVKEVFGELFKKYEGERWYKEEPWQGITDKKNINEPIERLKDLTTEMYEKVNDLCDDAVTYVNWTLKWPQFVQIVRSIRQGTFMGDLGWRAQRPNDDEIET